MAKTISLTAIRELDARVESQLRHFAANDEEDYDPATDPELEKRRKQSGVKSAISGTVAGATGALALYGDRKKIKQGAKDAANAGLKTGAKVLRKGASGLAGMRRKLHGLHALVDGQLQQFGMDPEDYVGARTERKKKKRAVAGGVLAAGAVAGGVAAAGKGAAVKAGARRTARVAADKTGDALFKTGKAAEKAGMKKTGKALFKGANKSWKGASKLLSARLDGVARGMVRMGI